MMSCSLRLLYRRRPVKFQVSGTLCYVPDTNAARADCSAGHLASSRINSRSHDLQWVRGSAARDHGAKYCSSRPLRSATRPSHAGGQPMPCGIYLPDARFTTWVVESYARRAPPPPRHRYGDPGRFRGAGAPVLHRPNLAGDRPLRKALARDQYDAVVYTRADAHALIARGARGVRHRL